MGVYHLNLEDTEKSKSIDLVKRMGRKVRLVYKVNNDKTEARYYGLYECCQMDEENEDYLVVPLTSVFISNCEVDPTIPIANVIGSTGDLPVVPSIFREEVGESWLRFYECAVGEKPTHCSVNPAVYNRYYISETEFNDVEKPNECNSTYCTKCKNTQNLVGGHVLINCCEPVDPKNYSGMWVGILPICNRHNNRNDGFMKVIEKMEVPLIDYAIKNDRFKKIFEERDR